MVRHWGEEWGGSAWSPSTRRDKEDMRQCVEEDLAALGTGEAQRMNRNDWKHIISFCNPIRNHGKT